MRGDWIPILIQTQLGSVVNLKQYNCASVISSVMNMHVVSNLGNGSF